MSTKIIIVFCEGVHDVAFLNRILKTRNFKSNESTKLDNYPYPMNDFFKQKVKKSKIEELNIHTSKSTQLPINSLLRDETHIFLYSIGGDSKKENRKDILGSINPLFTEDQDEYELIPTSTSIGIIYFFDADKKGIEKRKEEVQRELKEYEEKEKTKINPKLKIDTYVFTNCSDDKGKLEDIIVPLMKEENEDIFESAEKFLNNHFDDNRLFPLKLKEKNNVLEEERESIGRKKNKYDKDKSLIGIVCQLQKSGGSNTVCIGQTDYLNLEKINNNKKCQEILDFIDKFVKDL